MRRTVATLALATSAGLALLPACSSKEDAPSNGGAGGAGKSGGSGGTTGGTAGSSAGGKATGGSGGKGATGGSGGVGGAGGSSGTGGSKAAGGSAGMPGAGGGGGKASAGSSGVGGTSGGSAGAGGTVGGSSGAGGTGGTGGAGGAGDEAGWLYTDGNKVYVSDGNGGGTPWVGRGVNIDDLFFCGYNGSLWMDAPEDTLITEVNTLITGWKPTFLRLSLSMASNATTVSWFMDEATYKAPMTKVINAIVAHPGVYVLVTLRSDLSMIGQDEQHGDPEATGIPSDSGSSPDKTAFPRGSDPIYESLVDVFGSSKNVLFGLTNEPGGNLLSDSQISKAMDHAVSTIRAEEDKIGVPHHLVSVQGNGWTSDISVYGDQPLTQDNVVYEVHGYPPATDSYTYGNLPVIIGEYGSLDNSDAFYADLEKKQIPNLAWDFDPYSNCAPDLVEVNTSPTNFVATDWGNTVKAYLAAHAQ